MAKLKYKETFPGLLIRYAKEGLSPPQVASKFEVSVKTFYEWAKDPSKPRFMEAIDRYWTELNSYFDTMLMEIEQGKRKPGGIGALIYRSRKHLFHRFPEVLIDLKKEIITESKPSSSQVKEELKKILSNNFNLLEYITKKDDQSDRPNTGQLNS